MEGERKRGDNAFPLRLVANTEDASLKLRCVGTNLWGDQGCLEEWTIARIDPMSFGIVMVQALVHATTHAPGAPTWG